MASQFRHSCILHSLQGLFGLKCSLCQKWIASSSYSFVFVGSILSILMPKVGKQAQHANLKPWKCTANLKPLFCGHALSLPLNIRKHRAWTGTDERFVVVFADLEDRIWVDLLWFAHCFLLCRTPLQIHSFAVGMPNNEWPNLAGSWRLSCRQE